MTSTKRAWVHLLLIAALTTGTVAACTTDEPSPTTSPSSATPTTPSATPTQSPTPTPEDVAAATAEDVVRAWLRAQTDCLADPAAVEVTCFDGVAVGTELNDLRNALIGAQGLGNTVNGEMTVVSLDIRQVDLAIDLAVTPPIVPTVVFGACLDVSSYNIVDKDGRSIVPADRPAHVSSVISVYNYDYPDGAGWRVGLSIADEEAPSCAG